MNRQYLSQTNMTSQASVSWRTYGGTCQRAVFNFKCTVEGPLWSRCQSIWVGFTVSEDSKPVQRSGTHKAMWLPLVSCHTFIGVRGISTETYSHWRGWGHDMHCVEGGGETHTNTHIATCTDTQNMCHPGKHTCAHTDRDTYTYAHECAYIHWAQGSRGSSAAWIPA